MSCLGLDFLKFFVPVVNFSIISTSDFKDGKCLENFFRFCLLA